MRLLLNSPIWEQIENPTADGTIKSFFRSKLRVCTLNELRSLVLVLCVATLTRCYRAGRKKCPPRESYKSLRYVEGWSALRDPDCQVEAIAEEYADLIIEWWEGGYER